MPVLAKNNQRKLVNKLVKRTVPNYYDSLTLIEINIKAKLQNVVQKHRHLVI